MPTFMEIGDQLVTDATLRQSKMLAGVERLDDYGMDLLKKAIGRDADMTELHGLIERLNGDDELPWD